jgi:hypothetical protein
MNETSLQGSALWAGNFPSRIRMRRDVTFWRSFPSFRDLLAQPQRVLICLGAATAANCIPCFEYYFGKAKTVGLLADEIQEAVDLASQVKKGAHMAIKNCINGLMGEEKEYALPCDKQASKSCCG